MVDNMKILLLCLALFSSTAFADDYLQTMPQTCFCAPNKSAAIALQNPSNQYFKEADFGYTYEWNHWFTELEVMDNNVGFSDVRRTDPIEFVKGYRTDIWEISWRHMTARSGTYKVDMLYYSWRF